MFYRGKHRNNSLVSEAVKSLELRHTSLSCVPQSILGLDIDCVAFARCSEQDHSSKTRLGQHVVVILEVIAGPRAGSLI